MPVVEVDTTARTPAEVAARVRSVVEGRRPPPAPAVDWLADADVPDRIRELGG